MPAVVVRGITKHYDKVLALDGVSFDVEDGEVVTLLGPSGCGKSTTLRILAGLEQHDQGEVYIGGKPVSSAEKGFFLPPEKRDIGMVFQSYAIWPHMTVFGNVAYPLELRGLKKPEIRERVYQALQLVGLGGYEDRLATRLSGGQQQRVALARAIVHEPTLLLLDEPLSNLDAKLRVSMRLELKELQKRLRMTTVYVTHDQDEAMVLSDRVIVMNHGHIEQVGTPKDIYEAGRTKFVVDFIGTTNFVPAVLAGRGNGDGLVEVRVPNTAITLKGRWRGAQQPGQPVVVAIRPEMVQLHETSPGSSNVLHGCVRLNAYLGNHREYLLDVEGIPLRISAHPKLDLPEGARVAVTLDPEQLLILPAGGSDGT